MPHSFDWCVGNGLIDVLTQSGSAYKRESRYVVASSCPIDVIGLEEFSAVAARGH